MGLSDRYHPPVLRREGYYECGKDPSTIRGSRVGASVVECHLGAQCGVFHTSHETTEGMEHCGSSYGFLNATQMDENQGCEESGPAL
jgi:hypothetical protein